MVDTDKFPQEQQTNTPETTQINDAEVSARTAEQELESQEAASIAVKGIASRIGLIRARRAEKHADRIERAIDVDTHIHDLHHGRVTDPSTIDESSSFDVSSMTRQERKRAMKSMIKAKDAEWDQKTADRIKSANSGLGRVSKRTKRELRRDIEDRALTGQSTVKEMHTNKELVKLGSHLIIDGETQRIERSKPVRRVVRANRKAATAAKRSLITLDTGKSEQRAIDKRDKAERLRRQVAERQQIQDDTEEESVN